MNLSKPETNGLELIDDEELPSCVSSFDDPAHKKEACTGAETCSLEIVGEDNPPLAVYAFDDSGLTNSFLQCWHLSLERCSSPLLTGSLGKMSVNGVA